MPVAVAVTEPLLALPEFAVTVIDLVASPPVPMVIHVSDEPLFQLHVKFEFERDDVEVESKVLVPLCVADAVIFCDEAPDVKESDAGLNVTTGLFQESVYPLLISFLSVAVAVAELLLVAVTTTVSVVAVVPIEEWFNVLPFIVNLLLPLVVMDQVAPSLGYVVEVEPFTPDV